MTTEAKTKIGREVTRADGVRVRTEHLTKPRLEFFRSEGNRVIFVRLPEEDKDDDSLVSLYRLLEASNIDTERSMENWRRIRALTIPAYVERKLRLYYNLVELTEREWLAGGS